MKTNYENLQIYQLAEQLSDIIWQMVASWDYFAKDTVGKQIVRSADSVGANIAEGSGKGTDQDLRRFLHTARGSLYETKHWLRRAHKRDLLNSNQVRELKPIMDELLPKLNAYIRSLNTRLAAPQTKDQNPKT